MWFLNGNPINFRTVPYISQSWQTPCFIYVVTQGPGAYQVLHTNYSSSTGEGGDHAIEVSDVIKTFVIIRMILNWVFIYCTWTSQKHFKLLFWTLFRNLPMWLFLGSELHKFTSLQKFQAAVTLLTQNICFNLFCFLWIKMTFKLNALIFCFFLDNLYHLI